MEGLTKQQIIKFYEWLEQFISHKGYEGYYSPTDGGDYKIVTTEGKVFYQGTYEYNDWIKSKIIEFKQHNIVGVSNL